MRLDLEQFNCYDGDGCHLTVEQDQEGEGRVDLVIRLEEATEGWHGSFPVLRNEPHVEAAIDWAANRSTSVPKLRRAYAVLRAELLRMREAHHIQDHPVVVRQLTPDEARELAAVLVHHANETERKYGR